MEVYSQKMDSPVIKMMTALGVNLKIVLEWWSRSFDKLTTPHAQTNTHSSLPAAGRLNHPGPSL